MIRDTITAVIAIGGLAIFGIYGIPYIYAQMRGNNGDKTCPPGYTYRDGYCYPVDSTITNPVQCYLAGYHLENGVCVPDSVLQTPQDNADAARDFWCGEKKRVFGVGCEYCDCLKQYNLEPEDSAVKTCKNCKGKTTNQTNNNNNNPPKLTDAQIISGIIAKVKASWGSGNIEYGDGKIRWCGNGTTSSCKSGRFCGGWVNVKTSSGVNEVVNKARDSFLLLNNKNVAACKKSSSTTTPQPTTDLSKCRCTKFGGLYLFNAISTKDGKNHSVTNQDCSRAISTYKAAYGTPKCPN